MSQTTISFENQVQAIKVSDCIKITLDTEFLNANFSLIKQCLTRVQNLQNELMQYKNCNQKDKQQMSQKLRVLQKQTDDNKIVMRTQQLTLKELQQTLGADFNKKLAEIEKKSKNNNDINELIAKLQAMDKFVSTETFKNKTQQTNQRIDELAKIKQGLDRYIDNNTFNKYKDQTKVEINHFNNQIDSIKQLHKKTQEDVKDIDKKVTRACTEVSENNTLIKQINFTQMQDKLRKFKDQMDTKLGEMITRIKKKVGTNQLQQLQRLLIQKIDKFLLGNNTNKADKNQTKQALLFLEQRINQLYNFLGDKDDEENDSLFATKKWTCAACTKDLGKFEGKLGQFRPWAVFPCRQLNPEQSGGYGYLNYIDKISYRKGNSVDDSGLERLSKTFYDKPNTSRQEDNSPKKMNTTRTTNFMNGYGSTSCGQTVSLKQQYFKVSKQQINNPSSKLFRVKKEKDQLKYNEGERQKQKVKLSKD